MPDVDLTQFGMFLAMCVGFAFIWRTVNKGNKGNGNGSKDQPNVNAPAIQEIKTLVEATAKNVDSMGTNLSQHRTEVQGEFTRHTEIMAKLFDQDAATNLRVSTVEANVARVEGRLSRKASK